jgi:hypothetical protein
MVCHRKAAQVQGVQGAVSLRTVAFETPKSFATRAGLNPALTAARTMLAFAGGMSTTGAGIRTIRAAAGLFCFVTGGTVRLQPPTSEAGPIPRRRASPMATRADQVNQVVVLKLADILHEIGQLGPPPVTRRLVAVLGGGPVEQGELCFGES